MALSFRHLPGIFHDLTHTPLESLRNLAPNGGGEGIQCYHLGETRNFENHGQRKNAVFEIMFKTDRSTLQAFTIDHTFCRRHQNTLLV